VYSTVVRTSARSSAFASTIPMLDGPVTRPYCPTHCGHSAPITSDSLCGFSGMGERGGTAVLAVLGAAAGEDEATADADAGAGDPACGFVVACCCFASCLAFRAERLTSWSRLKRFAPGLEWRGSSATVSEPTQGFGDAGGSVDSPRSSSCPCADRQHDHNSV
jgi:hypothetical protein